jgi:hypothetical protein
MPTIELTTFKGCQPTVDFRHELEDLIDEEGLDIELDIVIVPAPESAQEMGLYGSPTILLDGLEFQVERRGPAGFY